MLSYVFIVLIGVEMTKSANHIRHRRVSSSLDVVVTRSGNFYRQSSVSAEQISYAADNKKIQIHRKLADCAERFLVHKRKYVEQEFSYVILVPTLRCNLACSYCQVSRVNEGAEGFDWTEEIEKNVLSLISTMKVNNPKIEFQGGEPLLRIDVLERVRNYCRKKFVTPEFIVCSNLQVVSDDAWDFLSASDTHLSTSFDGTNQLHRSQRTISIEKHQAFVRNLKFAIELMSTSRVSALPTFDINNLPAPKEVIERYASLGLRSIFLRPVNHLGFARKKHDALDVSDRWNQYRRLFIKELISYNAENEAWIEEFYLSHCLRRIYQPSCNHHVDLRNPNPMGIDYLVVDYDGELYPTDEARMITRSGQIDLSIGNVEEGIDQSKLDVLNIASSNEDDPRCSKCAYQAFCGVDRVDDISRYGTFALDRHETEFCRRHMDIFDHLFEMIYSDDDDVRKSMAKWLGISNFDPLLAPSQV